MMTGPQENKRQQLANLLDQRILVLDGAMGTTVFAMGIDETTMRRARLAGHHKELKNFVDILCLTRPEAVTQIHRQYLEAGADIIETNTFGSSPIGMEEFALPAGNGPRAELDGGGLCPQGGRRVHGPQPATASVCGGIDWPNRQNGIDFAASRGSGLPRRDL